MIFDALLLSDKTSEIMWDPSSQERPKSNGNIGEWITMAPGHRDSRKAPLQWALRVWREEAVSRCRPRPPTMARRSSSLLVFITKLKRKLPPKQPEFLELGSSSFLERKPELMSEWWRRERLVRNPKMKQLGIWLDALRSYGSLIPKIGISCV